MLLYSFWTCRKHTNLKNEKELKRTDFCHAKKLVGENEYCRIEGEREEKDSLFSVGMPKKSKNTRPVLKKVFSQGRTVSSKYFTLKALPSFGERGVSTVVIPSHLCKNSVERNFLKRRFKNAFFPLTSFFYSQNLVFILKKEAKSLSFNQLKTEVKKGVSSLKA